MTDGSPEPEETLRIYPLRIVGPARNDIEDAYAYFVRTPGSRLPMRGRTACTRQ